MGSTDLILIAALVLGGISVYLFLQTLLGSKKDDQILSWASGNEPEKSKSPIINFSRPLVHQFTIQHAVKIKAPRYRKSVESLLMTGGLSRELNVDEFIGLQLFWGVIFPLFMLLLNFALQLGFSPWVMLVLGLFGFYIPHLYARGMKSQRESSVRSDLPFFIDLLALSAEAGLDFISAIQRIVDKAQDSVLAEELSLVLKDIKLGSSRGDALRGLANRLDLSEITSFVAVLVDADATGASIPQVLKDQSVQMRLERFVRAEKAGARASQVILVPMMIFILPAVFIMVFGPVALQFIGK